MYKTVLYYNSCTATLNKGMNAVNMIYRYKFHCLYVFDASMEFQKAP